MRGDDEDDLVYNINETHRAKSCWNIEIDGWAKTMANKNLKGLIVKDENAVSIV